MIVDDHAGFRASAAQLLASEGFEIVGEADSGVRALRCARDLAPEVVLLDVGLPDFDGFEVAERLAQLDPAPAVVLTSSREHTDFASLIRGSSARGFIPKSELSGSRIEALL
ncbi:MAG: response regulator [Actinobacteria bacterium]|nr:MAG: response regulator [Actinomycetota bacterium]